MRAVEEARVGGRAGICETSGFPGLNSGTGAGTGGRSGGAGLWRTPLGSGHCGARALEDAFGERALEAAGSASRFRGAGTYFVILFYILLLSNEANSCWLDDASELRFGPKSNNMNTVQQGRGEQPNSGSDQASDLCKLLECT